MSPVRKPPTTLVALGALSGKPKAFVRHIWRLCRPIAVISRGTVPSRAAVGVYWRPHRRRRARRVLGSLGPGAIHRLGPSARSPSPSGRPWAASRWKSAQRVGVTAAVSAVAVGPAPGDRRTTELGGGGACLWCHRRFAGDGEVVSPGRGAVTRLGDMCSSVRDICRSSAVRALPGPSLEQILAAPIAAPVHLAGHSMPLTSAFCSNCVVKLTSLE